MREHLYDVNRTLDSYPTRLGDDPDEGLLRETLNKTVSAIVDQQKLLYADRSQAVLFLFQGMDCSGKDSTIKHVLSGVNPQGVHVANFREPTHNETAHSYLWRYWREMPRRGQIGVFNRSFYEEVIIMRVHPELFDTRHMPHPALDEAFWQSRFGDISALEEHLTRNGIHIVKFFLNLSREEQKERLLARINRPRKHWKFDPQDVVERDFWDDYRHVYQEAISATHSDLCPWYIIPADHKPTMRCLVARIMAETLMALGLEYPRSDPERLAELEAAKQKLLNEDNL